MKSRTRTLGIALASTMLVAAASGSAMAQDPVNLSYFTFSAAPDHLADLDAIVAAFEAANPGVTVDVQTAS